MPPSPPTRPAGGATIATAWGQWVHDWLDKRQAQITGNTNTTLTTSYQDIPGMSVVMPAGPYIVIVIADVSVGSAGAGMVDVALNVDSVDLLGTAKWQPNSTVTGRSTIAMVWVFDLTGTATIKVRAKKDTAGGAASFIGTNSKLIFL